jgi:GPH family glycoside/pentoside/hexuronide:cation symporter
MLGGDEWQRGRIVAWREGLGLVGVVLAALAPGLLGMPATTVLLAIALFLGWLAWSRAPRPRPDIQRVPAVEKAATAASLWHPLRRPAFRRLLVVFMLNGIASAIPATLVLFFVQDRLQAPSFAGTAVPGRLLRLRRPVDPAVAARRGPLWPGPHLAHAACCWPWPCLSRRRCSAAATRWPLHRGVRPLGRGAGHRPGLAQRPAGSGVIAYEGDRGQHEGAYFGWWNFATKFNLALAAGLALPLLALLGYTPGARDASALAR